MGEPRRMGGSTQTWMETSVLEIPVIRVQSGAMAIAPSAPAIGALDVSSRSPIDERRLAKQERVRSMAYGPTGLKFSTLLRIAASLVFGPQRMLAAAKISLFRDAAGS